MNNNIGNSGIVKITLLILMTIAMVIFWNLLTMIFVDILEVESSWQLVAISLLLIVASSLLMISGNVPMNRAIVVLNTFSKKSRAIFHGFYWKLPWEDIQYQVNLEGEIEAEIDESFPTLDGKMLVKGSIMSKPDSGEGLSERERSEQMMEHVKFTPDTIKAMQAARAKEVLRLKFSGVTSKVAIQFQPDELLKISDFEHLADELKIRIIECPISDLDFNISTQKVRDSVSISKGLAEMVDILVSGGWSKKEATVLAPLLNNDINLKKQVNDINVKGLAFPPALVKTLTDFLTKLNK